MQKVHTLLVRCVQLQDTAMLDHSLEEMKVQFLRCRFIRIKLDLVLQMLADMAGTTSNIVCEYLYGMLPLATLIFSNIYVT